MSDFLTNFSGGNEDPSKKPESPSRGAKKTELDKENDQQEKPEKAALTQVTRRNTSHSPEVTEVDPTYRKKQQRRYLLFALIALILLIISGIFYYKISYLKMPNFVKEPISDARTWAAKNKIELKIKQEFSSEFETNQVISQETGKGKSIKKGSQEKVVVSQGPDPDEQLKLPDFSKMSEAEAQSWIEKNKASNLSIVSEYNDTVEKNKLVRQEMKDTSITAETYRRKDNLVLFYSKGKEVFTKNISVPNFKGKAKSEVETWVKTNKIAITYEEVPSEEVESGLVIEQSLGENEKIAKEDPFTVKISKGKPIEVPNFANLTPEEAATVGNLKVLVKKVFNPEVPFGQLISQSVEPGTVLTEKDDLAVTVVYSEGKPYLKDLVNGTTTEGDLQKIFFEEYRSKGAEIYYTVKYVNSDQPKGTVVAMSAANTFVPLEYTVEVSISKGN